MNEVADVAVTSVEPSVLTLALVVITGMGTESDEISTVLCINFDHIKRVLFIDKRFTVAIFGKIIIIPV